MLAPSGVVTWHLASRTKDRRKKKKAMMKMVSEQQETDDFGGRRRTTPRKGHVHSGLEVELFGEIDVSIKMLGTIVHCQNKS